MSPFIVAWVVGEGIIIYRTYKQTHAPPGPGQLLWSSGLFALLALLAESQKARPLAILLAWGFDIAAFMNLMSVGVAKLDTDWPPAKMPDDIILPAFKGVESHAEGKITPRGGTA